MILSEVMKVINYPETKGKRIALERFNWKNLDKANECYYAEEIIKLAKEIDMTDKQSNQVYLEVPVFENERKLLSSVRSVSFLVDHLNLEYDEMCDVFSMITKIHKGKNNE